jgi:hypothetical protein
MNGTLVAAAIVLLGGIALVGFSVYQKKLAADADVAIAQTNAARDVAIHGQDVQLSIAHETKASSASQILSGIGNTLKGLTGPLAALL